MTHSVVYLTPGWLQASIGVSSFQKDRNAYYKNGKDSLLIELGKHGMAARDLASAVNFFSKV